MRFMGLDVGDKTIGVAISDEQGIIANPFKVIPRTASVKKDIAEVRKLAEEFGVQRIVVGMPYMMDGSVGIQAEKVQEFVEQLRRRIRVSVETWDERLTTMEVERLLISADQSRARRKKVVDKMAAAIILQSYMDKQKSDSSRETEDAE